MFVVRLSYLVEKRNGHAQVQTFVSLPVDRLSFGNSQSKIFRRGFVGQVDDMCYQT